MGAWSRGLKRNELKCKKRFQPTQRAHNSQHHAHDRVSPHRRPHRRPLDPTRGADPTDTRLPPSRPVRFRRVPLLGARVRRRAHINAHTQPTLCSLVTRPRGSSSVTSLMHHYDCRLSARASRHGNSQNSESGPTPRPPPPRASACVHM